MEGIKLVNIYDSNVHTTWTNYSTFRENDLLTPATQIRQIDMLICNIGWGSQADQHVWVIVGHTEQHRRVIAFLVKMTFRPQWAQITPDNFFRIITFVEGVKLLHLHNSRVSATKSEGLDAFSVEITFSTPVTT